MAKPRTAHRHRHGHLACAGSSRAPSTTQGHSVPLGLPRVGRLLRPYERKAPVATPKTGQCPSGFIQSGNYCLDTLGR
jgi:hypothetical protein